MKNRVYPCFFFFLSTMHSFSSFCLKIRNFGSNFIKDYTGCDFEGRTLRFMHLKAYLFLFENLASFFLNI